MTGRVVPEVAEIAARRRERWEIVHRDPASWAHLADTIPALLEARPDRYQGNTRQVLEALAWAAGEIATWSPHFPASPVQRVTPPVREHGTYAGWNAHRYRGETPCEPCRVAGRAEDNRLRRVRRARLKSEGAS